MWNKKSKNSFIYVLLALILIMNFMDNKNITFMEWITQKLLVLPGIVLGLSIHEFGHALASNSLGDPTPKAMGRLTLNPLAHMDPFGFVALLVAGFGWGVPVQINPTYYKNKRVGTFITSIAGVTMNLLMAIMFVCIFKVLYVNGGLIDGESAGDFFNDTLKNVIESTIVINVVLMIFNLIPIPPLDGFSILTQIFNLEKYSWYQTLYSNGFIILIVLLLLGVIDKILTPAVNGVLNLLFNMF